MSDPHAQLDPTLKEGLISFVEKRLGLIGSIRLLKQLKKCECEPCKTVKVVMEDHS